jgi:hypothetical protein
MSYGILRCLTLSTVSTVSTLKARAIAQYINCLEFRLKNRERWLSEELEPPPRERMRVKNKTYPLPQ